MQTKQAYYHSLLKQGYSPEQAQMLSGYFPQMPYRPSPGLWYLLGFSCGFLANTLINILFH